MKRVLTAVVLIPIVLLVVFRAPLWVFTTFLGVVALLSTWEYLEITDAYPGKPLRLPTLTLIVLLFTYAALAEGLGIDESVTGFVLICLTVVSAFVFLAIGMRRANLQDGLLTAAISYLAFPYLGLSLWSLVLLRDMGWIFVLFVLVVVWIGDTCAYYVGRSMGRHLMAPRISPKKTWEGAVASVVGSVVAGTLLMHYAPEVASGLQRAALVVMPEDREFIRSAGLAAVAAVIVNVAAQVGDLVESLIKRGANVKDSGSLLPGHGGMLDRIDALLFAAPVATLFFAATYDGFVKVYGIMRLSH